MPHPSIRRPTPADANAIAVVHVETWMAAYAGLIPDHVLSGRTNWARREAFWREQLAREAADPNNPTRTWVADDDAGQLAAFVMAGPARREAADPPATAAFAGEVYAVYVHPRAQEQGLGKALMQTAAADLVQRGMKGLLVWCLETNIQARGFYERLGGKVIGRRDVNMADVLIPEVGYGWAHYGKHA
jgi:ribosomal protein S18 acetylase RimI-like enzyme